MKLIEVIEKYGLGPYIKNRTDDNLVVVRK
jgi:hypothetical protein